MSNYYYYQVGRANKPHYIKYVELKNKQAVLNDHDDLGDEWRDRYAFYTSFLFSSGI